MLAIGLLRLLGIIALAFLVTPLMFYLIGITTVVLALTVRILVRLARQKNAKAFNKIFKKFLWSADSIMYHGDRSKYEIYSPNYARRIGVSGKDRSYIQCVPNLEAEHYWEGNTDNCHLDMPNQTITTKFEKVLNVFHRIILFYRSYYRHSTKVERNRCQRQAAMLCPIGICHTGRFP